MTGLGSTSTIAGSSIRIAEADDRVDDRRPVDARAAADPGQDRGPAQPVQHRRGVVLVDRRETDRDVVEHLGEEPAEPDHDERPEGRVAPAAEDQLDAAQLAARPAARV